MKQQQTKQKKPDAIKNPMQQTGQSKEFSQSVDHPYLQVQGVIGNHGILRRYNGDIIQAKLKISQPNDKYEQEADRAADQVMSMPEPGMQKKSTYPECEEDTDEALQTKPIADRITPIVQRQEEQEEEEEAAPENEEEEDENYLESEPTRDADELEEEEESIQAKSLPNKSPQVTPGLQNQIRSLKGGGQPLSISTRSFFEPRFGRDFSQVRVHTYERAAKMAKSLNAKAFTTGKDVVFGSGQYSPGTPTGKRLLAHELTHVVQQDSAQSYIHRQACSINKRRNIILEAIKRQANKLVADSYKYKSPWVFCPHPNHYDKRSKAKILSGKPWRKITMLNFMRGLGSNLQNYPKGEYVIWWGFKRIRWKIKKYKNGRIVKIPIYAKGRNKCNLWVFDVLYKAGFDFLQADGLFPGPTEVYANKVPGLKSIGFSRVKPGDIFAPRPKHVGFVLFKNPKSFESIEYVGYRGIGSKTRRPNSKYKFWCVTK